MEGGGERESVLHENLINTSPNGSLPTAMFLSGREPGRGGVVVGATGRRWGWGQGEGGGVERVPNRPHGNLRDYVQLVT